MHHNSTAIRKHIINLSKSFLKPDIKLQHHDVQIRQRSYDHIPHLWGQSHTVCLVSNILWGVGWSTGGFRIFLVPSPVVQSLFNWSSCPHALPSPPIRPSDSGASAQGMLTTVKWEVAQQRIKCLLLPPVGTAYTHMCSWISMKYLDGMSHPLNTWWDELMRYLSSLTYVDV